MLEPQSLIGYRDHVPNQEPRSSPSVTSASTTFEMTALTRHELHYQIRYAIRLTQRTARLYRRVQTIGTFLAIVGGSATLSLLAEGFPSWVGLSGAALMTLAGGALVAVRPADKAAQNEADARRYLALATKAHGMTDSALAAAIDEAHQSDCQEVEPLRDVAYNDIVREYGRDDAAVPLSFSQRILSAIA